MADLPGRIVRAGLGLLGSLVLPLAAKGIGWPSPLVIAGFSAMLGALCLWVLGVAYAELIERRGGGTAQDWLWRHLRFAALGLASVMFGALLLRFASNWNSQLTAAYALAFVLGGLVPVIRVIRVDSDKVFHAPLKKPLTPRQAWWVNATIIVSASFVPALIIAPGVRGLIVGGVAMAVWMLASFLGRSADDRRLFWFLVFGLGGGALIERHRVTGFDLSWWLYLLPVAIAVMIAWRRERPDHDEHVEWHLPFGVVLLAVAGVWFAAILGGEVAWTLVAAPILIAAAFGASLVIKGEGLLVIMGLGLLTVWVVQDHTPLDQPEFSTTGDSEHIVAFGDSYMSGEGIGTFYSETNTSGADAYTRDGEDNCRRSPVAYSVLVAQDRGAELDFRACSGAKSITNEAANGTTTLADEFDDNTIYGQLLRWESDGLDADAIDLVLLSLGGNDAGFSAIGTACFMPGSCRDAIDARREEDLAQVTARVGVALQKTGEVFPDTPIVVIAYPQMFGPDAEHCGGQVPFDGTEVDALGEFVVGLNSAVAEAITMFNDAGGTATHFSGGAAAFDGGRFCELDANGQLLDHTSMNILNMQPTDGADLFIRLNPTKLIHNTFHPTAEGHLNVAAGLSDFLDRGCHLPASDSSCRRLSTSMVTEVAEGTASNDSCPDIESYVECALNRTLRIVALPILALVLAGRFIAVGIKERRWIQQMVAWLRGRNGLVGTFGDILPINPEG